MRFDFLSNGIIRPKRFPLGAVDIEIGRELRAPDVMMELWREFGYGFFNLDVEGNAFPGLDCNLLMFPEMILDLKTFVDSLREDEGSLSFETDQFALGMFPFFNQHDREYCCLAPDGRVLNPYCVDPKFPGDLDDAVVAEDIFAFFRRLVSEPEFSMGL